jgi:hypothetical protein
MMANDDSTDGGVARDRSFYVQQSLDNAFGDTSFPDWDPSVGYQANRARIIALVESLLPTGASDE